MEDYMGINPPSPPCFKRPASPSIIRSTEEEILIIKCKYCGTEFENKICPGCGALK
jgi:aspartate carbamoyltransferase regulatory subunit